VVFRQCSRTGIYGVGQGMSLVMTYRLNADGGESCKTLPPPHALLLHATVAPWWGVEGKGWGSPHMLTHTQNSDHPPHVTT
jgi:hypothetical protein